MTCRYLFALQVKRDLSSGSLPCHEHTAILLASYIVQCLYHCNAVVPLTSHVVFVVLVVLKIRYLLDCNQND